MWHGMVLSQVGRIGRRNIYLHKEPKDILKVAILLVGNRLVNEGEVPAGRGKANLQDEQMPQFLDLRPYPRCRP